MIFSLILILGSSAVQAGLINGPKPLNFSKPGKPEIHLNFTGGHTGLLNPHLLTPRLLKVQDRAVNDCGCGYSVVNPNPASGRIVGGQEANPQHKLPYQAYLQTCFSGQCYNCGGTLLNKRYVLTAMHCVVSGSQVADDLTITLGEHNLSEDIETHKAQEIKVVQVIRRGDYDEENINNDIAILKLESDVVFNDNIVPACLPTSTGNKYENQAAIVSGWGTTSYGGDISDILMETTVKIVPQTDSTCTVYNDGGVLPNTKMCAYNAGTDSCQGDSGGPLVLTENGRNTVVGVVSYGYKCASPGVAGVYARVTEYLDWVNSNIQDGWCSDDSSINFPTDAPATTTTTAKVPASERCDLTCKLDTYSGYVRVNDILSRCDSGLCYALDGTDLCQTLDFPCAPANNGLTCAKPCDMSIALAQWMTDYQNGKLTQFVQVQLGYWYYITSNCDLATGQCCAADYPDSDLCRRLGWFSMFG